MIVVTLLGDGPTDRRLVPIIEWVVEQCPSVQEQGFRTQVADLRGLLAGPSRLSQRIERAFELWPCDVLFVHRDAERETVASRTEEIERASRAARIPRWVPVVPVRMTEAWLLIDERAIRLAAGSPDARTSLGIPRPSGLEDIPDPKSLLHRALEAAGRKRGRHLKRFKRDIEERIERVAALIEGFETLRQLPAFATFETEARRVVDGVPSRDAR